MIEYPVSRRDDDVDSYHGTLVSDPFRWLEEIDSAETRVWVEEQNKLTFGVLGAIPQRDEIRQRFEELWDFPRQSAPVRRGDW